MARKPHRQELGGIVRWLCGQVERLGADVRLGTTAHQEAILYERPDLVILATGATDGEPSIPGVSILPIPVVTARAAIHAGQVPGRNVLIVDHLGQDLGCAVAELVAEHGGQAKVVTRHAHPALDFGLTNTVWLYRRIFRHDIEFVPHHDLRGINSDGVLLVNVYSGRPLRLTGIDCIVIAVPPVANDGLLQPLLERDVRVVAIGDCIAPRDVENATLEGHRAGRQA
jgi:hypothetical protein